MQTSNKKEVSCKALDPVFYYAKQNNVDLDNLITGVPYQLAYLLNKRERIEWPVWCKIISNARTYFSQQEFEKMGSEFVKSGSYLVGLLPALFLFSSTKLARILGKSIVKSSTTMFSFINQEIEFVSANKVRIIVAIDKEHEFCPEFFFISKGYWGGLGSQLGHKNFNLTLQIKGMIGFFEASWNKESIFFKFKRALHWLFNINQALQEMTDSHEELLHQYQKLETSQQLLQKQATQLKSAYKISTAIKQSLNINETLKAITDALVKEAYFSAAAIQIFKDMDENDINIKVQSGSVSDFVTQFQQEIIVNDKTIGELIVYSKPEGDYLENSELLEYLNPSITIAIHDALMLSAIVDYKVNLEQKVANRTIQLQKAHDEITEVNMLLRTAHQNQKRFITNISHEFRTPLTLVLGPAKQILEQSDNEKTKTKAELIHRNAKRLHKLVDELLDISKIELGEMKLKACPLNLVKILKESVPSFYSLAERKKIAFDFNSDAEEIKAYVDKDKFDKILSNVLSNAFKFTPEGGNVELGIIKSEKFAEIIVADTGIGIPTDQIHKIFDRFYQVDGSHTREYEGTGIGLALTKELVELHKGRIEVESKEGKGSKFKIMFQLGKTHLKPEEVCEEPCAEDITTSEPQEFIETKNSHKPEIELTENPVLLIVEDSSDLRDYINMILGDQYKIVEAKDGEEGINKSFDFIPDFIISDVMMPKVDGFQLCRQLKTDLRTSHIPVIMLTAKATMQDKIKGLDIGADEYIMKPFDAEELKARIKNLLEQRKRLHEHFRKYGLVEKNDNNITPQDQQFLRRVVEKINKRLADETFGVEVLAEELNVSRSLLFKKIESLVGESPSELIKRTRLNKAALLIEKRIGNVSEIALDVGFSNPSYFAECFKKQFGISPSQYHLNSNKN